MVDGIKSYERISERNINMMSMRESKETYTSIGKKYSISPSRARCVVMKVDRVIRFYGYDKNKKMNCLQFLEFIKTGERFAPVWIVK